MEYVALKSFAGKVVATKGKKVTINDKVVAKRLVKAGYVKPVATEKDKAKKSKKNKEME